MKTGENRARPDEGNTRKDEGPCNVRTSGGKRGVEAGITKARER